jgi:hypothetical protein
MKTICYGLLIFLVAFTVSFAEETNALPTKITVGKETYEDVRWGDVSSSTVTIFHKFGVARIPLEKLPPELQERFGYNPKMQIRDPAAVANAQFPAENPATATVTDEKPPASKAALPDGTIDGEVFIVTMGGESIKLGLVGVRLYSMTTLRPFLKKLATDQAKELASLEPQIAAIPGKISQLQAAYDRASDAKETALLDISEMDSRYKAAMDAAPRAEAALDAATKMGNQLTGEYRYVTSVKYYIERLPAPFRTTKTNSDGRFSMKIPADGEFAISATATRYVGEVAELYLWLLRVRAQPGQSQTIMLSNDNATSSGNQDSLIQTDH